MGQLRTVWEVTRQTLRLQLQNRLLVLLVLAQVGVAALAFLLGFERDGGPTGRELFCALAWWLVACTLGPWSTMYFAVQAVHGDIEDRTFVYLFVRPVSRPAVLVGKWLAVSLLVAIVNAGGIALLYGATTLHADLWRDGSEPRLLVA